ncbi:hypothetical protein BDK51DRAFT_30428, partial [Blyttiomyces helicus]
NKQSYLATADIRVDAKGPVLIPKLFKHSTKQLLHAVKGVQLDYPSIFDPFASGYLPPDRLPARPEGAPQPSTQPMTHHLGYEDPHRRSFSHFKLLMLNSKSRTPSASYKVIINCDLVGVLEPEKGIGSGDPYGGLTSYKHDCRSMDRHCQARRDAPYTFQKIAPRRNLIKTCKIGSSIREKMESDLNTWAREDPILDHRFCLESHCVPEVRSNRLICDARQMLLPFHQPHIVLRNLSVRNTAPHPRRQRPTIMALVDPYQRKTEWRTSRVIGKGKAQGNPRHSQSLFLPPLPIPFITKSKFAHSPPFRVCRGVGDVRVRLACKCVALRFLAGYRLHGFAADSPFDRLKLPLHEQIQGSDPLPGDLSRAANSHVRRDFTHRQDSCHARRPGSGREEEFPLSIRPWVGGGGATPWLRRSSRHPPIHVSAAFATCPLHPPLCSVTPTNSFRSSTKFRALARQVRDGVEQPPRDAQKHKENITPNFSFAMSTVIDFKGTGFQSVPIHLVKGLGIRVKAHFNSSFEAPPEYLTWNPKIAPISLPPEVPLALRPPSRSPGHVLDFNENGNLFPQPPPKCESGRLFRTIHHNDLERVSGLGQLGSVQRKEERPQFETPLQREA